MMKVILGCLLVILVGCPKKRADVATNQKPNGSDTNTAPQVPDAVVTPHAMSVNACTINKALVTIGQPLKPCLPPCPDNSPVVNTFPINGIDKSGSGTCNPEGVQIVPQTLVGGKCPANSTLTFDGTKLVGTSSAGSCTDQNLTNSTFEVRSANGGTVKLSILEVKDINGRKSGTATFQGYRIVDASDASAASLCGFAASEAVKKTLGLGSGDDYTMAGTSADDDDARFVIALPDPLYSNTVREIDNSHKFFNLACTDDALAKRLLDGIQATAKDEMQQLAALRMVTATYCERPRTARKMKFHWERFTHKQVTPEAEWKGDHAICLQLPRLAQTGDFDQAKLPKALVPDKCLKKKCGKWEEWIEAVRDECKADGDRVPAKICAASDYDYESYTPNDSARMLFATGSDSGSGSFAGSGGGSADN